MTSFTEQAPFSTNSAVERTILYGLLCYTPGFRRAYNELVTYKRLGNSWPAWLNASINILSALSRLQEALSLSLVSFLA